MLKNETSFQRYAFDPDLSGKRGIGELSKLIAGDGLWGDGAGFGFQIKNIRRQDKEIPEWAQTSEGIQKVLLTAFPKLHVNQNQRKRAGRWAQIIQLYFQLGWTRTEVAAELNVGPGAIKTLTRSITRTSKGLRTDGSGPRIDHHATTGQYYGGSKRPSEPIAGDVPEGCQSLSSNLLVKETRAEDRT